MKFEYSYKEFFPYEPRFSNKISKLPGYQSHITEAGVTTVTFSAELSEEYALDLEDIIEHNGPEEKLDYKIYEFKHRWKGESYLWPGEVNFITELKTRLHPQNEFKFGELIKTVYYAETDEQGNYNIPVVQEEFHYGRDTAGFPIRRVSYIRWFYVDGTLCPQAKIRPKFYGNDSIASLSELSRRRDNNIKNIIGALIGLVMYSDPTKSKADVIADGQAFFDLHDRDRSTYVQDGNTDLENDVRNDTQFSWLNNDILDITGLPTIRSYVIYQLSMGERST